MAQTQHLLAIMMFMKMIMMLVNGDDHDGGDAEGTFSVVFDCTRSVHLSPRGMDCTRKGQPCQRTGEKLEERGNLLNHRLEGQDRCELERLKVMEAPEPTVQGVSQLASL